MINLVKAEFYKQKVSGLMSLFFVLMSIVGIGLSIINIPDDVANTCFDNHNYLFSNSIILYMVIATISAFYHIKDFSDKSIQHAIMSGYTRKDVIFSKMIVINFISIIAFILYLGFGIITSIILGNAEFSLEYIGSLFLAFLFKILFIIAYNTFCMLFCYLIRNAAAYFIIFISMMLSSIGPVCTFEFVANHVILKYILDCTIIVQDYKIFIPEFNSGYYTIIYVMVMIFSIIILYEITCFVVSKVEIK